MAKKIKRKKIVKQKASRSRIKVKKSRKNLKKSRKVFLGKKIKVETVRNIRPESVYGSNLSAEKVEPFIFSEEAENLVEKEMGLPEEEEKVLEQAEINETEVYSENLKTFDHDKSDSHSKKIMMYLAVSSIMIVIFTLWAMNIKNSLGQNLSNANLGEGANDKIPTSEIGQVINEFKTQFLAVKNFIILQKDALTNLAGKIKTQAFEEKIKSEVANSLKEKLENTNSAVINLNTNSQDN